MYFFKIWQIIPGSHGKERIGQLPRILRGQVLGFLFWRWNMFEPNMKNSPELPRIAIEFPAYERNGTKHRGNLFGLIPCTACYWKRASNGWLSGDPVARRLSGQGPEQRHCLGNCCWWLTLCFGVIVVTRWLSWLLWLCVVSEVCSKMSFLSPLFFPFLFPLSFCSSSFCSSSFLLFLPLSFLSFLFFLSSFFLFSVCQRTHSAACLRTAPSSCTKELQGLTRGTHAPEQPTPRCSNDQERGFPLGDFRKTSSTRFILLIWILLLLLPSTHFMIVILELLFQIFQNCVMCKAGTQASAQNWAAWSSPSFGCRKKALQ